MVSVYGLEGLGFRDEGFSAQGSGFRGLGTGDTTASFKRLQTHLDLGLGIKLHESDEGSAWVQPPYTDCPLE